MPKKNTASQKSPNFLDKSKLAHILEVRGKKPSDVNDQPLVYTLNDVLEIAAIVSRGILLHMQHSHSVGIDGPRHVANRYIQNVILANKN